MSGRIRFRQRITKKICVFFTAQRAHWIFADFWEKNSSFWEIKKNISPKTSLFQEMNNIFPAMVFCLYFLSPSLTCFHIDHFFYYVALINFSRKLSNVFFISSPSLTFPKIGSMFFFLNFFYRPPSLDFDFFRI